MPYVQQLDIEITSVSDTIFQVNYMNKFNVCLLKEMMFEINPTNAILSCILKHKNNLASLYNIKPESAFLYEYMKEVASMIVTITKLQPWYIEWKLINDIMES